MMEINEKIERIEKNLTITYQGSQITMFSDDRADYVNLTEMAKAYKNRGAIITWIRNKQTIEFLNVWERKYNMKYRDAFLGIALESAKERSLSIKQWVDLTNAIGVFTRSGEFQGTYAHKDIAIRFAGWLNPEFELFIVEEIQRLKEIEKQKDSFELLSHDQILALIRLKEVFKYVSNQEAIENAHKDIYAAHSTAKNPFADFQAWRNKILDIAPAVIDNRIKEYCKANNIAITAKIESKSKKEKILFYDSYNAVKNAVWDFLKMKGEVNALNLATLVEDIIRTEKGQVFRKNEENLFQKKQELGEFNDFENKINNLKEVVSAREYLSYLDSRKKELKKGLKRNSNSKTELDFGINNGIIPKSEIKPFPNKDYDTDYDF